MYTSLYIYYIHLKTNLSKLLMKLKSNITIFFCLFHNIFIKLKEKAILPRNFTIIPFEIEPYEFENFILPIK